MANDQSKRSRSREQWRWEQHSRGKPNPNAIRRLRDDHLLQLCRHASRCTNGDKCHGAHSDLELASWWEELQETIRDYRSGHHRLELCKFLDEKEPSVCSRGFSCKFAHSEEELRAWKWGAPGVLSEAKNDHCSTRRIRKLREDSKLTLCGYFTKCNKGDSCHWAHSNEELKRWWAEHCEMTRKYQPEYNRLELCRVLKGPEATKVCKNGATCRYAHSQRELSLWEESLKVRPGAGKMMELCRHGTECEYLDAGRCRYAHNGKELQVWKKEHYENYVESDSSIPERCTYTLPVQTCLLGIVCRYAHTEPEREKLMKRLATYDDTVPRPVPRADKLLPYQMCENHRDKTKRFADKCMYGWQCKSAHSKAELDSWERERKEESAKAFAMWRAHNAEECRLSLAEWPWGCERD